MNAQTKFEKQLRDLVKENKMQDRVHFVNKTLNVIPYLAAVDVLVQNSQVCCNIIAALYCLKHFKYIYTRLYETRYDDYETDKLIILVQSYLDAKEFF